MTDAARRGRAVYNARCYFCHGYDGRAATEAAAMLTPRPRDFTASPELDRADVLAAVKQGRPGTAMLAFTALVSPQEMEDVATFVTERLVACADPNTDYHTAENGWPDHRERYAAAIPYATGAVAVDVDADLLDTEGRAGLATFRSACVSCHEGRLSRPDAAIVLAPPGDHHDGAEEHEHHDEYDVKTEHDYAPEIPDLSDAERRGRDLYAAACAQCHAADGSGQNWIGKFLEPSPPDFRTPSFARGFDAAAFAASILEAPSGTTMPSFASVLDDAMAADIAAYVRRAFVER